MPPDKRNPFSLSTSWNYRNHENAKSMVDEIKDIGFNTIELNFALTESVVNDIIGLKKEGYINISSTHNFCPIPTGTRAERASPDYYSLASLDEDERQKAVHFTKRTIAFAKDLGAKAVMLHTGKIRMKDITKKMGEVLEDKKQLEEIKSKAACEREAKKAPYVEKVQKSLKELIPFAKESKIKLAIENRFYHSEIPGFEDLKQIFDAIQEKELFYWHDTGHAQVYEICGFQAHEDYLRTFSNRLIGIHLHDIMYPIKDHMAPGTGCFDFRRIIPFVKPDTLKVIEVHRPVTGEEIVKSVKFLSEVFYD